MRIRVLEPEEHDRVAGLGAFAELQKGPSPDHSAIVVAENDAGDIMGYWCAFDTVHVEPLWIDPKYQKNAAIGRGLWGGIRGYLRDKGVPSAFAMIEDWNVGTHLPMATRLGFHRMPASILYIDLTEGKEHEA